MNVRDAKICLVCDEIYTGNDCPRCGGSGWYVTQWIPPAQPKLKNHVIMEQEQLELFGECK